LNIDYATVFSLAPFMSEDVITLIGICLLIGAMAKSSQIGQMKALEKLGYDSDFS
jgi:NADH-ubiquinone oxidoreductase chain 5